MQNSNIRFSVFTKPWKSQSIDEIGRFVSGLGFRGIEFPLREGYQVEPANADKGLPLLVRQLSGYGLKIESVAGSLSEKVFAGCEAAGVPIIRIMAGANLNDGYFSSLEKIKKELDGIIPLCERFGVKVGIQHHCGPGISNSMELRTFLGQYNPQHIAAIWDVSHSALAGEEPEQGLEIAWPYLCMVNFKNVFYKLASGPEAEKARWERYFTSAKLGLASWFRAADYLKSRGYNGVICLTAEYTDGEQVNRLIADDLAYAKELFAGM